MTITLGLKPLALVLTAVGLGVPTAVDGNVERAERTQASAQTDAMGRKPERPVRGTTQGCATTRQGRQKSAG